MTYTTKEERWNTLTHGLGVLLAILGTIWMIYYAYQNGDTKDVVCATIYGSSLILLYLASTTYHASRTLRWRNLLRKVDHLCIYLLIAGTYTPVVLIGIGGFWGWLLFSMAWGLALLGFIFQFSPLQKSQKISLLLYGAMGWLILIGFRPMLDAMPPGAIAFLVAGGLLYTAGIYFYVKDRIPYNHAIWHLFVLGGSTFHFLAIFLYVIPGAGI